MKELSKSIRKIYIRNLCQDIPNFLQVLTFTSFLAIIVHNVFVIALLTTTLLELYFSSKTDERIEQVVIYSTNHNRQYALKSGAKTIAMNISNKFFLYNQIASVSIAALGALIALGVVGFII